MSRLKKHLGTCVRLIVSVGILFLIIKNIDLVGFSSIVKNAKLSWILGTWVLLGLFMIPLSVVRLQLFLVSHNIRLPFSRVLVYQMVGYFYNTFLPGGVGGDIIKAYYIAQETHKKHEAVAAVIADRIVGLISLFSLAVIALFLKWNEPAFHIPRVIIACACILAGICLAIFFNKKLMRRIPFGKTLFEKVPFHSAISRAYDALHYYKNQKTFLVKAFAYSLVMQLIFILAHVPMAFALGMDVLNPLVYITLVPIAVTIAAIPISIQGWGIGEAVYIKLFGLVGIASAHSLALSVIMRLMMVLIGIVGAGVYMCLGLIRKDFTPVKGMGSDWINKKEPVK